MTDFESYAERVRAALAERRALAQAATYGPWKAAADHTGLRYLLRFGLNLSEDLAVDGMRWQDDAIFIAANDPAHVLALLDRQEAAVEAATEGLRRHQPVEPGPDKPPMKRPPHCSQCQAWWDYSNGERWPCDDADSWWSVLTGIGTTYGVET
jgi:hypothetical protein